MEMLTNDLRKRIRSNTLGVGILETLESLAVLDVASETTIVSDVITAAFGQLGIELPEREMDDEDPYHIELVERDFLQALLGLLTVAHLGRDGEFCVRTPTWPAWDDPICINVETDVESFNAWVEDTGNGEPLPWPHDAGLTFTSWGRIIGPDGFDAGALGSWCHLDAHEPRMRRLALREWAESLSSLLAVVDVRTED